MMSVIRSELIRRWRPRTAVRLGLATVVVAAVAAALLVGLAPDGPRGAQALVTTDVLAQADGGTTAFRVLASFAGLAVLTVVAVDTASDVARGTLRTALLHQPGRARLLIARLAAVVVTLAAVVTLTWVATWAASWLAAQAAGIDTAAWTGADAVRAAVRDLGRALAATTVWSALATTLAVLLGSTSLTVGTLLVWAGPFEHVLAESWEGARRWFPELLTEALVVGGDAAADVSLARAAALTAGYAVAALAVAVVTFGRRDITS